MDWADVIPCPATRTATMANRRKKYFAGFPSSTFIVTPKVELFALTWNASPAPTAGNVRTNLSPAAPQKDQESETPNLFAADYNKVITRSIQHHVNRCNRKS